MWRLGAILSFAFCPIVCAEGGASDRIEGLSFLAAVKANSESIRSYDVLIVTEKVIEDPVLDIPQVTLRVQRIIHDRVNSLCFFACRQEQIKSSVGSRGVSVANPQRVSGFVEFPGGNTIRDTATSAIIRDHKKDPRQRLGMDDIRIVGLYQYEGAPRWWNHKVFEQFDANMASPQLVWTVSHGGDQMASVRFVNHAADAESILQKRTCTFSFDKEKLIPLKIRGDEIYINGVKQVTINETLKWSNFGGIFVPATVESEVPLVSLEGGEPHLANKIFSVRFHWLRINEIIEGKEFDSSNIVDVSRMMELTDEAKVRQNEMTAPALK